MPAEQLHSTTHECITMVGSSSVTSVLSERLQLKHRNTTARLVNIIVLMI